MRAGVVITWTASLGLLASACNSSKTNGNLPGSPRIDCTGEQVVAVAGVADTGLRSCPAGVTHRPRAVTCGSLLPRTTPCENTAGKPGCVTDADCSTLANGMCAPRYVGQGDYQCACVSGCTTDADCGAGRICLCGDPVGTCVTAGCTTDTDCGGGYCRSYAAGSSCPAGVLFQCESTSDTCTTDSGCGVNKKCAADPGNPAACVSICID